MFRLLEIIWIVLRQGVLVDKASFRWLSLFANSRTVESTPAQKLRLTLEKLGPIFIKLGQILSTRRELVSELYIQELSKLRDQVSPMPFAEIKRQVELGLNKPLSSVFEYFDEQPIAAASIAQVHFARLFVDGQLQEVAVKVLRPDLMKVIYRDLKLMRHIARCLLWFYADVRRLKPFEVIAQLEQILEFEQDLLREGVQAQTIEKNFESRSDLLLSIPHIYWQASAKNVLTMSRIQGIPIDHIEALRRAGANLSHLAEVGAKIFFQQVFVDGLFHADMHPGNVFVRTDLDIRGSYAVVDFGIVGTLSKQDRRYLAMNFLAFFKRDYRRVAELHVQSGWIPSHVDIDELATVIRTQCDPFFGRSIADISLGSILMGLFTATRRFGVEIQPQLVLLQKTQLNIEALAKMIDPDLDLWSIWTPLLERWMRQEFGFRSQLRRLKQYFPVMLEQFDAYALNIKTKPSINSSKAKDDLDGVWQFKARFYRRFCIVLLVIVCGLLFASKIFAQAKTNTSATYKRSDVLRWYGFAQFGAEIGQGDLTEGENPIPLLDDRKRFQIRGKGGLTVRGGDRFGSLQTSVLFEQRFYSDTGESTSGGYGSVVNWNAQSWAAVSGGFGTVRVGRNYSVVGEATSDLDPWRCQTIAGLCGKFTAAWTGSDDFQTAGGAGAIRWNSSVTYYSPVWKGWSFDAAVAPAEEDDDASRYAIRFGFNAGNWEVNSALECSGAKSDIGDLTNVTDSQKRQAYEKAKAKLWVASAVYRWDGAALAIGTAKLNQQFTYYDTYKTITAPNPTSVAITLKIKSRLLKWFDSATEVDFDEDSQSPRFETKKFDDDGEFRLSHARVSAGSGLHYESAMWSFGYFQQITRKLSWSLALATANSNLDGLAFSTRALELSARHRF